MRNRTRGVIAAVAVASAALAVEAAAPRGAKAVAPDLYIVSFTAEPATVLADGSHRIRLTARVGLRATTRTSTGPFKIAVAWRAVGLPDAFAARKEVHTFRLLQEAGIASLAYDPASRAILAPQVRTFEDTVPAGREREYRLTIDSMKQVAEGNEANNQATVRYRATGCPGTDLQLTRLRLQRRTDGDTRVDVWIKNRCSEPCETTIYYVIDESEAVPGGTTVERGIVPRLDGETEVGPVGATVADGIAGEDATYTVRIEPRGTGCRETNNFNNSCRATIRAGEAEKTVDCTAPGYVLFHD